MLKKLFGRQPAPVQKEIVVVSGLPRSGTSMMMKMLEQGGLQVVTDSLRTADDDNPNGYYEFETVKQMPSGQTAWLDGAQGKVVKVISALLEYLPPQYHYKVIFMERAIGEVLASQKKMLVNRQEESTISDAEMQEQFQKHVAAAKYWLARQPNISVLYVDYNKMLTAPDPLCQTIVDFLDMGLDIDKMRAVPNERLYRNRVPRS
ncbi:MAG: sulfotransferase family protein [Chloroflexi bacterium]|nr:sulfotransferase family protein [Chloroflexota bacterium]